MKLFSEITRLFQCHGINSFERLSTIDASFSIEFQKLPNADEIRYLFSLVPKRDTLTLSLETDSEEILRIKDGSVDECALSNLVACLSEGDEISVKIQIDKTVVDMKFSIFDFASFSNDLLKRSLIDVLKWFSERLRSYEYLIFEIFDCDISFSTRTMAFESGNNPSFRPSINRLQRLNVCKESAHFFNMDTFELIPDDFLVEGVVRSGNILEPLFGRLATILSLIYVVSSASISGSVLRLQLNGHRTTNHELNIIDIREDKRWTSIYSWIFTDGNPIDKALTAHNAISLYCKFDAILNIDATVFEAIKTNYNLYLQKNIDQYLKLKHDVAKFIQDVVANVGDYALAIMGKFRTNLIAIFSFLFTVVLTQIGSIKGWKDIFSEHTFFLIEVFAVCSGIYLLTCVVETCYKLQKIVQGYDKLKQNYSDVLSELELKEAFKNDELLNATKKTARNGMIIWSLVWSGLLTITIVGIEFFTTNHGVFVWAWNKMFRTTDCSTQSLPPSPSAEVVNHQHFTYISTKCVPNDRLQPAPHLPAGIQCHDCHVTKE